MNARYREAILRMYNERTAYDTEEGTLHPELAQELVDLSPLKAGDRVLDVATGTGLVAFLAAKVVGRAGRVTAVDMSEGLLAQARRKVTNASTAQSNLFSEMPRLCDCQRTRSTWSIVARRWCYSSSRLKRCSPGALPSNRAVPLRSPVRMKATIGRELKAAVQSVLGPAAPQQMHEVLGTREKIVESLRSCHFTDIHIWSRDGGSFRQLDQVRCSRNLLNLMFKGADEVEKLGEGHFEKVCEVFRRSLETLSTDKGAWQDQSLYLVSAVKA